ncbi:MAG: biotin transporter BioY [Terracidiphilus sp.]|nr:biotin transporter BioY [Terracidiphilus sp.]
MNQNLSISIEGAVERAGLPAWLRTAGVVLLGTVFLAVCAHIAIPLWFTPVPLTLQPFGVLVLGLLLRPRLAAGTVAAYLAEGALGLPVFAPTATALGGLAHLLGPTGGYLLAYPAAALVIALAARRAGGNYALRMAAAAAGDLMILAGGALWLAATTHTTFAAAFALAVVPFLPGDALKVAAAAAVGGLRRLRR